MTNFYKLIRNKKVKINVENRTLILSTPSGKVVEFVPDGKDCFVKYNSGCLGGERIVVDGVVCCTDPNPKEFANGDTYTVYGIAYYSEKKARYSNGNCDYYQEVFLELKTDDGYYSDVLLHSDTISVYVDKTLIPPSPRRIFAGFYRRYDGMQFYVVDVVRDLETKQEVVICKHDENNACGYFTLTMDEFCAKVKVDGKMIKKYFRDNSREKASETFCKTLEEDGYPTPIRKDVDKAEFRRRRSATTYLDYAKDLCKHYNQDLRTYQMCRQTKRLIGVDGKADLHALKEDLLFLHDCLKTTLKEYAEYFKERFIDGVSLRKYGERHNLNRGSAEYLNKKFLAALADNLQKRDQADGICRLK